MNQKSENFKKKKILTWMLPVIVPILFLVLIVLGYVSYVFLSYHRIDDNKILEANNPPSIQNAIPVNKELKIVSWNIGFAAYLQDFSFFMDGGTESRARSKAAVIDSMQKMTKQMQQFNANLYLVQEVDFNSTRTYHVDERQFIYDAFEDFAHTFAQNYNSPYLFYPLRKPHGASKSGLVSLSQYKITEAKRRSLPIQTDFAKFLDLDRCYSVSRIPVKNGKELILINLHLSAYTTDPTIADKQLDMIYEQIEEERKNGNYIICGGDFNKDLLTDSGKVFGIPAETYSWCQPFKEEKLPAGFKLIKPYNPKEVYASCRNVNAAYDPKTIFRCTIDGFIISDNIQCNDTNVIELHFMWSDHNPVYMDFSLISEK